MTYTRKYVIFVIYLIFRFDWVPYVLSSKMVVGEGIFEGVVFELRLKDEREWS